jgi:V/A-type H+-transporting ATPase subunit C
LLEVIFDPENYTFWIIIIALIASAIAIISRPFSTYVKFVYPNAKFEAIGNPYVLERELTRIVENKNLDDFLEAINTSKDYNVTGDNIDNIQQSLDNHLLNTIDMMKNDSSKKMTNFFDTYIEKLDIYLIKNILKSIIEEKILDEKIIYKAFLPSTKKFLQKLIDAERENIPELLKVYGFNEEIINLFKDEKIDFIKFDIAIDKFVINRIKKVKVPYKCNIAKERFANTIIDLINIKNALRAKQIGYNEESCLNLFLGEGQEIAFWKYKELAGVEYVPQVISALEGTSYFNALKDSIEEYNKEKSVQVLENALDSVYLKLIKNISLKNYVTIGPTIRFLVSKEYEIKNLKAIVKGIGEGISSDIINSILVKEVTA